MSKDREYIKELFDSDGIRVPESLSEENMLAMLNAAEEMKPETHVEKHFEPKRAKSRPSLKRWMAVAAVAVIAVFGVSGLMNVLTAPPDTSVVGDELYTFKSQREIERLLSSLDNSPRFFKSGRGSDVVYEENAVEDSAAGDTGAEYAWHSLGQIHKNINLFTRYFIIIAQRFVGCVDQLTE